MQPIFFLKCQTESEYLNIRSKSTKDLFISTKGTFPILEDTDSRKAHVQAKDTIQITKDNRFIKKKH